MVSPLSLFEQQQERLPPAFLPEGGLSYDDLPWAAAFSVQAQLKRMADLVVAGGLLLLSIPFVGLAALLIWLEDRARAVCAVAQWMAGSTLPRVQVAHHVCPTGACTSALDSAR